MKRLSAIALLSAMWVGASAQTLVSPAGQIKATVSPQSVTITHGDNLLLEIPTLGLVIDSQAPTPAKITSVSSPRAIIESYDMLVGKKSACTNSGNAYTLTCEPIAGHPASIEMRLYDDGLAYRYVLDGLAGNKVTDELTTYLIPEGTNRWIQQWTQPYEDFFPYTVTGDTLSHKWGYPALIEPAPGVFALISEADIHRMHSASYLTNSAAHPELYKVSFDTNDVANSGRWASPWRTVIIGDLPTVVESTLITDISTPTDYADLSWIHPGSVSWVYWAYNHGSNDFQIVKKYIDMAATLNLPYILIDAEWDEMANGGDVNDAIAYAHTKGVKPLLWYNSSTAWTKQWGAPGPHEKLNDPADREREFAWLESQGVAGVKIDFFDGDTQPTMQYCIDLLECAAKHHLLVNFHGATIPRGWQRTYPNLMSVEGVYGAEWYNNKPTLTTRAAAHNATLPFTRNVIGPMDYTPTTFSDSQHPHITSNAHELALPVLFESALTHWADKPESYLAQPVEVQEFITTLPTVWDDTRLLGGYPAKYVLMARRSGDKWYVAAINGLDEPQTISVDWPMLRGDASYTVQTFADGADGSPWDISTSSITLADMPSTITMQPRGGYIAIIE